MNSTNGDQAETAGAGGAPPKLAFGIPELDKATAGGIPPGGYCLVILPEKRDEAHDARIWLQDLLHGVRRGRELVQVAMASLPGMVSDLVSRRDSIIFNCDTRGRATARDLFDFARKAEQVLNSLSYGVLTVEDKERDLAGLFAAHFTLKLSYDGDFLEVDALTTREGPGLLAPLRVQPPFTQHDALELEARPPHPGCGAGLSPEAPGDSPRAAAVFSWARDLLEVLELGQKARDELRSVQDATRRATQTLTDERNAARRELAVQQEASRRATQALTQERDAALSSLQVVSKERDDWKRLASERLEAAERGRAAGEAALRAGLADASSELQAARTNLNAARAESDRLRAELQAAKDEAARAAWAAEQREAQLRAEVARAAGALHG